MSISLSERDRHEVGSDVLGTVARKIRGKRGNGGHLRELQYKLKSIGKVENLHQLASSMKVLPLTYAVRKTLNL